MMRTSSKIILWFAGILLAVSTFFQLLAMIAGVWMGNSTLTADHRWLMPVWIAALVLLVAGFILTAVLGTRGKWPILTAVMALVGALLAVFVTLALRNAFPAQIGANGNTQGLTSWRLFYRHISSSITGVTVAVAALLQYAENREMRRRYDNGEQTSYRLSDTPIFKDESTLNLSEHTPGMTVDTEPRKMKRSQKDAARKAAEQNPNQPV